ncbi:MAG: hypothetical protein MI861_22390 [Pirellulales bacterium]|nr:hypothetical protein [Pirellulales bacterium]
MNTPLRWAALAISLGIGSSVSAEKITLGTVPQRPAKAGFSMTVEIDPVGGHGYHPVYLNFSALGLRHTRDRYIQVSLQPHDYYDTELDYQLTYEVKLPEGTKANQFVVYLPHYYPWNMLAVELFEEGRPIETSRAHFGLAGIRPRYAKQNTSVGLLVPSGSNAGDVPWKRFPDVRTLVTVLGEGPLPEDTSVQRLPHGMAEKLAREVQPAWVQFRPLLDNALHETWLAYSQLDIIVVSRPLLSQIEENSPSQFKALKDWVAAGGNLWVYAANLATPSSLLDDARLRPVGPNSLVSPKRIAAGLQLQRDNDTSDLIYEDWNGIQKESQHYSYRSRHTNMSSRKEIFDKLKAAKHPFAGSLRQAELAAKLRVGTYGAGKVTTISMEDPFPGSFQLWRSVANNLHSTSELHWVQRNGIDVWAGNDNYWMWLIRSVGQPPVKSFILLNTFFVVVIGPCCYFLFRRRGRLYLLYFFAPCLAALVTAGLFAYALAADGLKTKSRVRQITWLDPKSNYALNQSRQTYYAVFGGSDGLAYGRDMAVYPVRNSPAMEHYYRRMNQQASDGQIVLNSESRILGGGFLPSRNQVQFLVSQPRQLERTLTFDLKSDPRQVTNHLEESIEHLVVCDHNRVYWQAKNVVPDATVELRSSSMAEVAGLLNESVLPPLGEVPMLRNNRGWGGTAVGMQVSSLETRLEKWKNALPQGSFVATAEFTDDQMGDKQAMAVDSVHVLMGELP